MRLHTSGVIIPVFPPEPEPELKLKLGGKAAAPCHLLPSSLDEMARLAFTYPRSCSIGRTVSKTMVRSMGMAQLGFVIMKSTSPEFAAPRR